MKRFNIRVYGLLLIEGHYLLVREEVHGKTVVKFPGGGLEWGESTTDCLRREFLEETGLRIDIKKHVYTTDIFMVSAFNAEEQLMLIYYEVTSSLGKNDIENAIKKFFKTSLSGDSACFYFMPSSHLSEELFTFPIDKKVAKEFC